MPVYFAKCANFVKIGRSKNVEKRLKTIQNGCPHKLELLRIFYTPSDTADAAFETWLHNRFRNCHSRGEWFHASPELLKYADKYDPELKRDIKAAYQHAELEIYPIILK